MCKYLPTFFLVLMMPVWTMAQQQAARSEIKVGVLLERSGAGASIGDDALKGLELGEMAFKTESGPRLKLIYGDTHDDAMAGVSEFRRMLDVENVSAIYAIRSKIAMPLNPLSKQSGLALVGGVGHPDFVAQNPYALRIFPSAEREGQFLAREAIRMGKRRLAVITLEDEWNLSLSNEFAEEFKRLGGVVVLRQTAGTQDADFSSLISRTRSMKPDAVFINLMLSQLGPVARKLREQGVTAQFFTNYWMQKPEVIQSAAGAAEGVVFAEADIERPVFREMFSKRYPNLKIIPAHYLAFVAYRVLAEAVTRLPPDFTSRDFADALITLKNVTLPDEILRFENREAQIEMKLRTISQGQAVDSKADPK